jgi:small subunit ribosomal protein S21
LDILRDGRRPRPLAARGRRAPGITFYTFEYPRICLTPQGSQPSIDPDSDPRPGSYPRKKGFSSFHHCLGVFQVLAEIKVQEGESIENALRRFKRKVQQEDIIKDIKKHSFYLKPGDKRRAKQALARKRNRKKIRRETE